MHWLVWYIYTIILCHNYSQVTFIYQYTGELQYEFSVLFLTNFFLA